MTTHSSPSDSQSAGHPGSPTRRVGRWIFPTRRHRPINPALVKHAEERAANVQNRLADRITEFAGSMAFVHLHVIWFACWIGFGVERYPFGLLTMIVSLEAIFLSTFVMISQNRADAKRQVLADQQWKTVQEEERQNLELLKLAKRQDQQAKGLLALSNQILSLTREVRSFADIAREDHQQNQQLLDLSRRTLALTQAVHSQAGAPSPTDAGISGGADARKTDS